MLRLRAGSIKLIHIRIEDSIPVAWGYLSYGIDTGGCDFIAIDYDFVNNSPYLRVDNKNEDFIVKFY